MSGKRESYESPVHLFVDLPSLLRAARLGAEAKGERGAQVQIHAAHLGQVMAAGRLCASTTLVTDQTLSGAQLAPFRRRFRHVLVADRTAGGLSADGLLHEAISQTIERPEVASTIVVATSENAAGAIGGGLSDALVAALRHSAGIELVTFERASRGVLRKLEEEFGVVVLLDEFYDSVTFVDGGRSAVGPALRSRPTTTLEPWNVAAQVAANILNGRPTGPRSWRWVRSAFPRDPQEAANLVELVGTAMKVAAERRRRASARERADPEFDGWDQRTWDEALDRVGLRGSERKSLVHNFERFVHALA
jgi:hypothetical protein